MSSFHPWPLTQIHAWHLYSTSKLFSQVLKMSRSSASKHARHKPDIRVFLHILTILLVVVSFVLTTTTAVGIGGISQNLVAGRTNNLPWIVPINQTSTSTEILDGKADTFSLRKWGFGPWGWCEWTNSPLNLQKPAVCTRAKGVWQIPEDAPSGDSVLVLDLPE